MILAALGFATSSRAGCTLGTVAELPVIMEGGQPTVATTINGSSERFVANTGAGFSIIFNRPAQVLHLPHSDPFLQLEVGGLAGATAPWATSVKRLGLGGRELPDVSFVVAGHEAVPGAIGFLGQNILGATDTEYDLANGVIRLMQPKGCGKADLAYWVKEGPYSVMPLGQAAPGAPQLVGTATINGVRVRVLFQTTDSVSTLSLSAARRIGLKTEGPGVKPAGLVYDGIDPPVNSWITPVASIRIGDEEIRNTAIRVSEMRGDADMKLGLDFFLSHRIFVAKSQDKIYFTYNGGPVFDLARKEGAPGEGPAAPPADASKPRAGLAANDPADAEGYGRRAAASEARGDLDGALRDFGHAVDLAPKEPRYLYRRAMVHGELHQPFLAMNDVDAALALKPDHADALVLRASLHLAGNDRAAALKDAEAASAAAPKDDDVRRKLGNLYSRAELYPQAIAQFSLWIATHDNDREMAQARNGRCWARALANVELKEALADCDAAIRATPRASPGAADYLDSRGLVDLRRGEFARAMADYDAALALKPTISWSLYGRGLAELRTGAKAKGDADMAAAVALAPKLPDQAAKLGLAP